MGLLKSLFNRRAEGCRKAMLLSYEKHFHLAREGSLTVPPDTSPHFAGLYGALGTRYVALGMPLNELIVMAELGPFQLMSEEDAPLALAEYVVYKEQPKQARISWLKTLINNAFRTPKIPDGLPPERVSYFLGSIVNHVAWHDLLDADVMKTIDKQTQNLDSDLNEDTNAY